MTDYGNRMLPIEPVEEPDDEMEQVVEPETKEVVEEPIFDRPEKKEKKKRVMSDDAKQKLRDRLAKAREKSLAVRKAKAEEKKKNKKPVGRPKKVKEETDHQLLPENPVEKPEEEPKNEVVMEVKEQQPQTEKPVDNHNKIDYDKIINGIYEKMKPKEQPKPIAEKTFPSPRQRQQDLEARIRADERMRIKLEQEARFKKEREEKQAKLKKATHNYYSRLPQNNFFEPTDWDNLFNPK